MPNNGALVEWTIVRLAGAGMEAVTLLKWCHSLRRTNAQLLALHAAMLGKSDDVGLLLLPALIRDIVLEEAVPYTTSPRTSWLLDRARRWTTRPCI